MKREMITIEGLAAAIAESNVLEFTGAAANANTEGAAKPERKQIVATPYVWRDPATIPPRDFLYGRHLIRGFLSATVAPGGGGKSSLAVAQALSCVSGKALLGGGPQKMLRVWLWNLEEPYEEMMRKIQACAKRYGLTPDDLGDRLFVNVASKEQRLIIALSTRDGSAAVVQPVVDDLVEQIVSREIDIVVVDPFVSCHRVSENSNDHMDLVAKEWGRVADEGNCAVELIHHVRKGNGAEVDTESSRGAKAVTDACRSVRIINRMSKEEGEKAGVENHRQYFRTYVDKGNLAPPAETSDWYKLESVDLGNGAVGAAGDNLGIVTPWEWPDPLAGMTGADFEKAAAAIRAGKWRESPQATEWVGYPIARALKLNLSKKADKAKIKELIKIWIGTGALAVVDGEDSQRKRRKFVEVSDD
jgi:hypothetical protein